MARALQLAERALYQSDPNPRVGCVLVKDGEVIAEGWTQAPGQAHAEVHALQAARQQGQDATGATAYVTLEPCCFTGKTGPCTQALIDAGIARVVYAVVDPHPQVAGKGIAALSEAGIEVVGPLMEDQARQLNPGFFKRQQTGLPFVRIKMAMSLDGRTAMASGESKWITSAPARRDVQYWRARSSAVISGIGTVQHDNPELCVRPEELSIDAQQCRQPLRVIVDSKAQLTAGARTLKCPGKVLHVIGEDAGSHIASALMDIADEAYQCVAMPLKSGKIDLHELLRHLASLECNEVLVEAGATLAGQFVQQGLVDEMIIYLAPKLLGSRARPLFDLPLDTMAAQLGLRIHDIRAIGQDWRITATIDPEA